MVGAGVVGAAVAHALAAPRRDRRDRSRPRPSPRSAPAAPTPGSSIRASTPYMGELETELILRSGELRRGAARAARRARDPLRGARAPRGEERGAHGRGAGRCEPGATASTRRSATTARSRSRARRSPTRSPTPGRWSPPRSPAAPSCAPVRRSRRSSSDGDALAVEHRRRRPRCAAARPSTAPACAPTRSPRLAGDDELRDLPAQGRVLRLRAARRRAARADPAARADRAHQGRARVPDRRRQGDRRPHRPRPGRQGRLVGAPRRLRRGHAEGGRDAARRWRAPSRSRATPACARPGAGATT